MKPEAEMNQWKAELRDEEKPYPKDAHRTLNPAVPKAHHFHGFLVNTTQ